MDNDGDLLDLMEMRFFMDMDLGYRMGWASKVVWVSMLWLERLGLEGTG